MAQCLTGPTEAGRVAPCKSGARGGAPPPFRGGAPLREYVRAAAASRLRAPPSPRVLLGPLALSRRSGAGLRGRPASGAGGSCGGLRVGLRFLCCGPRRRASRACLRLDGRLVRGPAFVPLGPFAPLLGPCLRLPRASAYCRPFAGPGGVLTPLSAAAGWLTPARPSLPYTYFRSGRATPRGVPLRRENMNGGSS